MPQKSKPRIIAGASFDLDSSLLKRNFLEIMQVVHPDYNTGKSAKEKDLSDKQAIFVNKAYNALKDPFSRCKYILHLNGVHIEEGAGKQDAEFLIEILAIWEEVEEAETAEEVEKLLATNNVRIETEVENIKKAFANDDLEGVVKYASRLQYWKSIDKKLANI